MDVGYDLRVVRPARSRVHKKVRDVVEHRSGVFVDVALRSIPLVFSADAVLAMLESRAVIPAWFKRHGLPPYARPRLGVLSCWWGEELRHLSRREVQRVLRVIEGVDVLFVLSENQVALFEELGVPEGKTMAVPYGVDETYFHPGLRQGSRFRVLSAGVDRGRDYPSLLATAELLPDVTFDIFTHEWWGREPKPTNVRFHDRVDLELHRHNVADADIVVIPTHDLAYPTGQSVFLEALSCARPTVITQTEAISGYAKDGINCRTMPLHDPEGMARVIRELLADPVQQDRLGAAGRASVLESFTYTHVWRAIGSALAGPPRSHPSS